MTFEESVTGCHCLDVTASAERFSVSGKQKCIFIVVADIFQRFCPETDHLLTETVELLRTIQCDACKVVVYFVDQVCHRISPPLFTLSIYHIVELISLYGIPHRMSSP